MDTNRHLMGRRQFLIASSTCAIATAAVGPKLFAGGLAASPKRLAIGFALDENVSLASAASVSAADWQLAARGARVSVSGASGASADPRSRRTVDLLTHFAAAGGESVPFRAWSSSRTTGCQGCPVSFNVPVDESQQLAFSVETECGAPAGNASRRDALLGAATESTVLPVTLHFSGEGLKLARGFYVIVPLFEDDSEPRWRSYSLKTADGRWALHDDSGRVAPFEHFVLRVDYAKG